MTKQDAINGALRWIDEATVNGAAAANGFIADYKDRAGFLLDNAVAMVESQFPVIDTVSFPFYPAEAMQGSHYEVRQIKPGAAYTFEGAKSFSLEVCGDVIISVDGKATTLTADEFTRVAEKAGKLIIASPTPFLVRNAGFYDQSYRTVPEYIPWVPCELPKLCNGVERVLYSGDGVTFCDWADWKRVNNDVIAFPRSARGQFDVQYRKRHAPLPPEADAAAEVEVDPKAASLVPLRLAIDMTTGIDEALIVNQYLNSRFTEMVNALLHEDVAKHQSILTTFSIF